MNPEESIQYLKGVGPVRRKKLNRRGIYTVEDLLYTFPRIYENYREKQGFAYVNPGEKASLSLRIMRVHPLRRKGKLRILTFDVTDREGHLGQITYFNAMYLRDKLKPGTTHVFYGEISTFQHLKTYRNPQILKSSQQEIEPVYPQGSGVNSKELKRLISNALEEVELEENLPKVLREAYNLPGRMDSVKEVHFPTTPYSLNQARNRLVFEEFFFMQLGIFYLHSQGTKARSLPFRNRPEMDTFFSLLPFSFTTGQQRVWEEIREDMVSGKVMNRLVQGDVGSGKTAVAAAALYFTVINGYQGAMMAPTEILARQHFESLTELFQGTGVKIALVIGAQKESERKEILKELQEGVLDIVVGTHALIEETVQFFRLGLTITDEQHRFGVKQRQRFQQKAKGIHTLVMSATPIPRTLALTLYGDLDVSVIDTLPPGRKPVETVPIGEEGLLKAYDFVASQLKEGRQAYFVCPLIEENEDLDLGAVEEVFRQLKEEIFPMFRVGLLHGKMKNIEKEEIMEAFKSKELDILVSTTVIEVGVNVPNANVMFIYNAERFGLAQLHQLRGRVGRGVHKGTCILYNTGEGEKSWERMRIMQESQDGFYISQKDMELRGSGDVFGTRQHGLMDFAIADPVRDMEVFRIAQKEARRFHRRFPFESLPDNPVRRTILRLFDR